jgi:hypothetical protein
MHYSGPSVDTNINIVRQRFESYRMMLMLKDKNNSHHSVSEKERRTLKNIKPLFFSGSGQLFADFRFSRGFVFTK